MQPSVEPAPRQADMPPPRHRWLVAAPAFVGLLGVLNVTGWTRMPFLLILAVFVGLMLLNAVVWFPRGDGGARARRRLPLIAVLVVVPIAAMLFGPLGVVGRTDPVRNALAIQGQYVLLATAAILPLALLPAVPGGRRFTLSVGVLNLLLTFLITSVSILILDPGS